MKRKKISTIEDLATLMQSEFLDIHERFEQVDGRFQEVHKEFKKVHGSLDRIERKIEFHDGQILEIKDRLKVVEIHIGITS